MTVAMPNIPDADGVTEVRGQFHRTAHGEGCDGFILDVLEPLRAQGAVSYQARYKPCPHPSHHPSKPLPSRGAPPPRQRHDMTGELIEE